MQSVGTHFKHRVQIHQLCINQIAVFFFLRPECLEFLLVFFELTGDNINALMYLLKHLVDRAGSPRQGERLKQEKSENTVDFVQFIDRREIGAPIIGFIFGARVKQHIRIVFGNRVELFHALFGQVTETHFDKFAIGNTVQIQIQAFEVLIFANALFADGFLLQKRGAFFVKVGRGFFHGFDIGVVIGVYRVAA